MMNSISIPAINTLTSADATAIREITMSLITEIEKLNKKISDMEEARKKAYESNQRRKNQ
jgi:hypothetical protein